MQWRYNRHDVISNSHFERGRSSAMARCVFSLTHHRVSCLMAFSVRASVRATKASVARLALHAHSRSSPRRDLQCSSSGQGVSPCDFGLCRRDGAPVLEDLPGGKQGSTNPRRVPLTIPFQPLRAGDMEPAYPVQSWVNLFVGCGCAPSRERGVAEASG